MSRTPVDYLRFPTPYYFGWEADGQAIVWNDGRTIVFREELAGILRGLGASKLPPIGAVCLVLSACRENWREPPSRRELVFGKPDKLLETGYRLKAFQALEQVHEAWLQLRQHPLAKQRLAAAMCDGKTDDMAVAVPTDEVLKQLATGDVWFSGPPLDAKEFFYRDLRTLAKTYGNLDGETLAQWIATSLETLVEPAREPLALPPGGTVRSLLSELECDDELAGIAKLARLLLASVELPRSVSDPDEFAQGGVSDIANRGELDRLLLSELAHDDLTLAVRVAMREALYLRREAPPRTPPRRRLVLTDLGVRMWGLPRIFATSIALALAAEQDERLEVAVYRTDGRTATSCDFTTRAGLLEQLGALDHRAHPGPALTSLVEEVRRDGTDSADVVLITCEEVLADRDFQRCVEELELPSLYLATAGRTGEMRILERTQAGRRVLRKATLNLDDALAERPKKRLPVLKRVDRDDLPAILHVQPFPLLLSAAIAPHRAWEAPGFGVLQLGKDERLLGWTSSTRGAAQLAEGVCDGRVLWTGVELVEGQSLAVLGKLSQRGMRAVSFDVATREVHHVPLTHGLTQPRGVTGQGSVAFVFDNQRIHALDTFTGQVLTEAVMPPAQWVGQRFFRRNAQNGAAWSVVSFDGRKIHFTEISNVPTDAELLIEPRGREGFAAVTRRGMLVHLDTGWARPIVADAPQIQRLILGAVARDGLRFAATAIYGRDTPAKSLLCFTLNGTTQTLSIAQEEAVEPALRKLASTQNVRQRFASIVADADGRLLLSSRRGQYWPLTFDPQTRGIVLAARPQDRPVTGTRSRPMLFESRDSGEHSLRSAVWPDGSQAWLDTRGILHLRSSDPSIQEISIVLAVGETSGWVSDGRFFGPAYFHGDENPASAEAIYHEVLRPFLGRVR